MTKKPVIHKIEFTPEQQEEITAIKECKATPNQIKAWKKRGFNLTRNFSKGTEKGRKKLLQQRFFHGTCMVCQGLPQYKVLYDVGDAKLVEHFCSEHLPKEHGSLKQKGVVNILHDSSREKIMKPHIFSRRTSYVRFSNTCKLVFLK